MRTKIIDKDGDILLQTATGEGTEQLASTTFAQPCWVHVNVYGQSANAIVFKHAKTISSSIFFISILPKSFVAYMTVIRPIHSVWRNWYPATFRMRTRSSLPFVINVIVKNKVSRCHLTSATVNCVLGFHT